MLHGRQRDLRYLGACIGESVQRRREGGQNLLVDPLSGQLADDADADASNASLEGSGQVRVFAAKGSGVGRVVTGDHTHHQGGVLHGAGDGTYLIETRSEGNEPMTGHQPVGGFQTDHPAQRSRLPDRAAGIGAEGQGGGPGGHRHRRSSR